MDQLHANILELENKLIQLKERYGEQKLVIKRLELENQELKKTILTQQSPSTYNKQKLNSILEQLNNQDDKDIKKVLERYIKHIEDCITLLENSN